jgi:hypothetical protein
MNFARIIMIPFFVIMGVVAYRMWQWDLVYEGVYFAISFVAVTIISIFAPQINWYFWQYYPPPVPQKLEKIVGMFWPELEHMPSESKKKALTRILLYTKGNAVSFIGDGKTPLDIQAIVASIPVRMTFAKKGDTYLMYPYERVILYAGAFPSPDRPYPHTSETHHEDKVLILSFKHLQQSFERPDVHFNIGFYEYAGIYQKVIKDAKMPIIHDEDRLMVEHCMGFTIEEIKRVHQLDRIDLTSLLITGYWTQPNRMKEIAPNWYDALKSEFG